jgi:hypothetical protein
LFELTPLVVVMTRPVVTTTSAESWEFQHRLPTTANNSEQRARHAIVDAANRPSPYPSVGEILEKCNSGAEAES